MLNEIIKVRVETSEKEELVEISEVIRVPISQIAREAIEEKVERLKATHPKLIAHFNQIELSK